MEQRQFKPGWTVKGILGACFAPMGLLFLLLGFLLAGTGAVSCGFDDDDWPEELKGKQK